MHAREALAAAALNAALIVAATLVVRRIGSRVGDDDEPAAEAAAVGAARVARRGTRRVHDRGGHRARRALGRGAVARRRKLSRRGAGQSSALDSGGGAARHHLRSPRHRPRAQPSLVRRRIDSLADRRYRRRACNARNDARRRPGRAAFSVAPSPRRELSRFRRSRRRTNRTVRSCSRAICRLRRSRGFPSCSANCRASI